MQSLRVLTPKQQMEFKSSQYEFEREIHNHLDFGDETAIAANLGRSVTLISQQLNPHDERESDLFKAYKLISAQLENNQCRGLEMLQTFCLHVERHVDRETEKKCPAKVASSVMTEFAEMMSARLESKPLNEQLREIDDAIRAAKLLKDAVLDEMSKEMAEKSIDANGKFRGI